MLLTLSRRVTHYCVAENINLAQSMWYRGNTSSIFAPESLENTEEMFPCYRW